MVRGGIGGAGGSMEVSEACLPCRVSKGTRGGGVGSISPTTS